MIFYQLKKIGNGFIGFSGFFSVRKDHYRPKIKVFGNKALFNFKLEFLALKWCIIIFLQTKTGIIFSVSTTQKNLEKVFLRIIKNSWRRVSANQCLSNFIQEILSSFEIIIRLPQHFEKILFVLNKPINFKTYQKQC